MISQLFAIKDAAVDAYGPPFNSPTIGIATRSFTDAVNEPQNQMNKHPEDFALFHLGHYDDQTGKVTNLETPEQVARGKNVKEIA